MDLVGSRFADRLNWTPQAAFIAAINVAGCKGWHNLVIRRFRLSPVGGKCAA